ncbi:hypothetical protein QN277_022672 [Acacia crassicarpa]|uniref:RING-type domain-containing protein n=1 Tax=Acacia crassicarpa TaxID=499986 RepID=A0AAE1KBY2_9FABA|nr:hypothetical protein QN277_022672 [Acacia crassicarpa]
MTFKKPQIFAIRFLFSCPSRAGFSSASTFSQELNCPSKPMGNSNDEDKLHASTSRLQGSEEQGCNLCTTNSADIHRVNDNVPGISQSHNREIAPSGGNLMTTSSQSNLSLLNRPHSGFLSQNAASFNPISRSRVGNTDQPPLDINFGVPMFGPNQGAVSLNSPEMLEERHLTPNSGSNTDVEVNTNLSGIHLAGESNRGFDPSLSAHHSTMHSRRLLNPNFDLSGAISGFQDNNEIINDLPQNVDARMHSTGSHYPRPVRLGPPSLPSESNQIMQRERTVLSSQNVDARMHSTGSHYPRPVRLGPPSLPSESNQFSGFQDNKEIINDLPQNVDARMHSTGSHYPRPVRLGPPSLPSESNQIMQCERTVFSSPGMISNQPLSGQLPQYLVNSNQNFSLQSSTSLVGTATGRTRGMDPSNLVMRNMTSQATRPRGRSSHKRGASEPQSSLAQARLRRTTMNDPHIFPSVPTMTGSAPLTRNTTQTIFPSSHEAIPFTSQATVSTVRPPISTWARTASSAPSTSQTIPPSIRAATSHPPGLRITSPPRSHWRPSQSLPSTPDNAPPIFIEGLDETPGLLGYQCCLCKRDLNLTPGNQPIAQLNQPPGHAVLPCGHTFHDECLNKMTPEEQKHDPPCIPCALGE